MLEYKVDCTRDYTLRRVRVIGALKQFLTQEIAGGKEEFSVSGLANNFNVPEQAVRQSFAEVVRSGLSPHDFVDVVTAEGNATDTVKSWSAIHRDGNWHRTVQGLLQTEDG
ncbi:MAG: hypothetical protein NTZ48_02755, partial [Candidatus Omnitrophica bacterium]|nr:hypothetical protein [Candidatus Omnitrophota bacterium]